MLSYAQKTFKTAKPGMILVNNPWGESNEKGLTAALAAKGMKAVGIEKFEGNDVDVVPQLTRLKAAGADTLFLVGNVGPSAQVVKSLDRMGWKVPIVSHWGPAGGRFTELAGPSGKDVHFVQTYSFFGKQSPVGEKVMKALMAKYPDIKGVGDVTPAVGVANAYDAMQLTALAISAAGSTDGDAIRQGFYKIANYDGLIKTYNKPFRRRQARRAEPRRLRLGAVHRQPHRAGRRHQLKRVSQAARRRRAIGARHAADLRAGQRPRPRQHVRADRARLLRDLRGLGHGELRAGQLDDAGRGLHLHLRRARSAGRIRSPSPLALLLCALYGLLVEFVAVRPFVRRGSDAWLMATVALGIVLDNVVLFTFGKEPRSLPSPLAQTPIELGGVGLGVYPLQVLIPVVGLRWPRPCMRCRGARAGARRCSRWCRTATPRA